MRSIVANPGQMAPFEQTTLDTVWSGNSRGAPSRDTTTIDWLLISALVAEAPPQHSCQPADLDFHRCPL